MTRKKWIVTHARKAPFGPVFHQLTIYSSGDLVALTDEFEKNRDYEKYTELFNKTSAKITDSKLKKSGYAGKNVFFKQKATRIARLFFDMLSDDLIFNDAEYNFNPKAKWQKRHVLTIGYMKTVADANVYKKKRFTYVHGGLVYYLKVISPRKKKCKHRRYAVFCNARKAQMRKQILNGMRYHTFYKDRLFSMI